MAKTKVTLANGTQIIIEGTPTEVATIMSQIGGAVGGTTSSRVAVSKKVHRSPKDKKIKHSPTDLILSLADGGFFKTPKDLAAIKEGLAEIGHIYAVQTLSSIVFKMVRRHYLRRVKEKGRWVYIR
ncbi:MAG: hypothetical protein Q8P56_07065 [Candidatus Uhrbacteria bacterium]|nr:hypothetical protein [Candidatus Uhrbacteria bacterium]